MRPRKRRDERIAHKSDRWTVADDERLMRMRGEGALIDDIATAMQRTSNGIAERLKYLRRKARSEKHAAQA